MLPDEIMDHKYVYEEIGYNLKPLELQASIGLVQLNKLDFITERRKHNFEKLLKVFKPYEDSFVLPSKLDKADVSWFAFPLTLKDNAKFKRTQFTTYLEDKKIQTRNYFGGNILLQPGYSHLITEDPIIKYPIATKVTKDTFFLGTSPVITDEQIDYIQTVVDGFMLQQ
jgi:CDP-6-deoxy-D-xylo-4-hexulose-3-dehydrase